MESNIVQSKKFWRAIGNHAELVFEQGTLQTGLYDEIQGKNYEQPNIKECQPNQIEDDEAYLISEGPSREIIEFEQNENLNKSIEATIKQQAFILDETSNVYLTTSRSIIPDILITINESFIKKSTDQEKQQQSTTIIEVMLCQKSSCPERQKFKILKGGITGCSRKKVTQKNKIQFKGLKFNYNSNPDKNSKLLIALYRINKDRIRSYVQILVSRDIFLIEDGKAITIDTYQSLYQYFENFTVDFMQRPPTIVRMNKQDKHAYHEQISTFEKYLIKKNKKVAHIVYLAFKFPHFVELYFRNDQKNQNQNQQVNLNLLLANSLKQILNQINNGKYLQNDKQLVCNHFNPDTKIVLSINANMRRVRFLMKKQFTKLISIIASEEQPNYQHFEKFNSNKQLKEFYLQYYSNSIRCKSPPAQTLPPKIHTHLPPATTQQTSSVVPNNGTISPHELNTSQKKHGKRNADQDYQQEEEQDVPQAESDQSQNYSLSEKKVRKHNKKQDLKKNQHHYNGMNSKQIKYPTRNKTRQLQNDQDQHKKAVINRKNKQKQLLQQQQTAQQLKKPNQPQLPGNLYMGGMPSNMPFQIVNPQNPQMPSMGMFPMMQGLQIPAGLGMQNPGNKQSNQGQNKTPNPIAITPQMMSMMPNLMAMQGGLPAQMGGMMGQPMGIFNPAALIQQQQQKKQSNTKDGKQETNQNPMMKPQQMPAMMPMGLNPAMLGMQGLNPGMNPFAQGMPGMPGMAPIAIQGPNGAMMLMMPNMMGQNPAQNPNNPQNTGNNPTAQIPGLGGFPAAFTIPASMGNPFAMGMNPLANNQNSQNSNDKNSNSTGMTGMPQNPMMGMMPQMMNPALLNQIMQQQNKSFMQKKDQQNPNLLNQSLAQQQTNLNKNITPQFNPLQKTQTNKIQNGKKDQKPQGTFPPNMQNIMGGLGGFGQMPNPQGMMMFPPGMPNQNMMHMMQGGFGATNKDKSQQNEKSNVVSQVGTPQGLGQLGMGFGSMLGGLPSPGGLTPQMLQQLAQSQGGSQMLPMGMMPQGFGIPGMQGQNSGSLGQSNQGQQSSGGSMQSLNPMGLQGNGLGQMGGQNINDVMRQQQALQQMMRKSGMFMPSMGGLGGMGGMGGMFMPPKKDDQDKK